MTIVKELRKELGFKDLIIYHYCSLEALYGIITSKSLWLTCLESTNDKKELLYGKKILNDVLQDMINDENYKNLKRILEIISTAPADREYKKYRTNYCYYGASFVENKDSLTHWERYGNAGNGVCIAFNVRMINNYLECLALPDICTSWLWHSKIIYNYNMQKEYIKSTVLSMIDGFINGLNSLNTTAICNSIYYSALSKVKPMYKHSGFLDENEYRLILEEGQAEATADYFCRIAPKETESQELFFNISKHIKDAISDLNIHKKNKKHSIIGKTIRSYYSMNLSNIWGDVLIPEIIVGPRCYQNKRELISFMKSNGLERTKVLISDIPIR